MGYYVLSFLLGMLTGMALLVWYAHHVMARSHGDAL